MLSSIPYATFANYSPRGPSDLSKKSRKLCSQVKAGAVRTIRSAIPYLQQQEGEWVESFLGSDVTFVPVPRSAPLTEGALWPSLMIAQEFNRNGYGQEVFPCIKRIRAIRKSSTAGWGNRPSVSEHYDTLKVERDLLEPSKMTLVDDVLTKGSTVFACALRLHERFPQAEIRAFAMIRTQGLIPDIIEEDIVDPSIGTITYNAVSDTINRRD